MGLPIDLYSVVWLLPKALWEPEAEAANPDDAAPAEGASAAIAGTGGSQDDSKRAAPKLIFKGFSYDSDFAWQLWDSAMTQAWVKSEKEDDKPLTTAKRAPATDAGETPEDIESMPPDSRDDSADPASASLEDLHTWLQRDPESDLG
jgi:hypothetical protein